MASPFQSKSDFEPAKRQASSYFSIPQRNAFNPNRLAVRVCVRCQYNMDLLTSYFWDGFLNLFRLVPF